MFVALSLYMSVVRDTSDMRQLWRQNLELHRRRTTRVERSAVDFASQDRSHTDSCKRSTFGVSHGAGLVTGCRFLRNNHTYLLLI